MHWAAAREERTNQKGESSGMTDLKVPEGGWVTCCDSETVEKPPSATPPPTMEGEKKNWGGSVRDN